MKRRRFLKYLGLGTAGAVAAGAVVHSVPTVAPVVKAQPTYEGILAQIEQSGICNDYHVLCGSDFHEAMKELYRERYEVQL